MADNVLAPPRKRCRSCEQIKKSSEFWANAKTPDRLQNHCKTCQRRRRAENVAVQRRNGRARIKMSRAHYVKSYGLTPEQVEEMARVREWKCDICGGPPNGRHGTLQVDHNHETGAIRGMLCWKCNMGLGYFKDSPGSLIAAASYLQGGGSHR